MKRGCLSLVGVSVTQDAKSPFWVAQWSLSNGARVKRSTKVPVEGGLFQGERLSKVQARKRALLVAQELAAAAQVEAQRHDNMSVRVLFDTVLKGKLGSKTRTDREDALAAMGGITHMVRALGTLEFFNLFLDSYSILRSCRRRGLVLVWAMRLWMSRVRAWRKIYGFLTDDAAHCLPEYTRAARW